jgi:hypothetical protein
LLELPISLVLQKEIYGPWREDKDKMETYMEGDAHDSLLIAEKLAFG